MRLTTYDEFLTTLCDSFDALISPMKLRRTNRNVIYLILKAVSKAMELINSVCYALSGRFDPRYCADSDLDDSAALVGTTRRPGSGSGLMIVCHNNNEYTSAVLTAGTYHYAYSADVTFTFELTENVTVAALGSVQQIAMSDSLGSFPVTEQNQIQLTSDQTISSAFAFSCLDNSSLLGRPEESLLEFRERLKNSTDRQNGIIELEDALKALPYLFDARVIFNNTAGDITVDGGDGVPITVHNACLAIFFEGNARQEIAKVVAEHIIAPTTHTDDAVALRYEHPLFYNGYHTIEVIPFRHITYNLRVVYLAHDVYVNAAEVQNTMTQRLRGKFNVPVHRDMVTESEFYAFLDSLALPGIRMLEVEIQYNGSSSAYVNFPPASVAQIGTIEYQKVSAT